MPPLFTPPLIVAIQNTSAFRRDHTTQPGLFIMYVFGTRTEGMAYSQLNRNYENTIVLIMQIAYLKVQFYLPQRGKCI